MCRDHSPLAAARPGREPRLDPAFVGRVLDGLDAPPLAEVIPSTRGEPLLWEGLDALLDRCAAAGLRLNVTTNGTFPGRGGAGWAERLVPVASDVKVSGNGATTATTARIMGGLQLDRVLPELRAFLRVRDRRRAAGERACCLSFQVTAQESNVGELQDLVALAATLGVERVKVNQLQVHFPELAGDDLRRSPASRARWNAAVEAMRAAAARLRLPSGEPVALQNVTPWPEEWAGPEYGPCPFLDREAWVTAEGRFAPCPAPAADAGRLGDFGSLRERTLRDVWRGPEYRALVEGYERREACARCPFRRPGGV
jgi:MoaA/NifB/PqqE/SkfB family radical SAM enzyme